MGSSVPPQHRAEWWAARAALAGRRLRPIAPIAALLAAAALGGVVWLSRSSASSLREAARAVGAPADTTVLAARVAAARTIVRQRDSVVQALAARAVPPAVNPTLNMRAHDRRDSLTALVSALDALLERATRAPLPASYRALGSHRALVTQTVVKAALDSLEILDRARHALDPGVAPQRLFAELTERTNAIGATVVQSARTRREGLRHEIALLETPAPSASAPLGVDTVRARLSRDSARAEEVRAVTALREANVRNALHAARVDSVARQRSARLLGTSPGIAVLALSALFGVIVFAGAVAVEARAPSIANAREVERLTGLPVLATATRFRTPREGRARLQAGSGVDPFRMVYLALTASGTREHTVCVTADQTSMAAEVAGRLAVNAAADERATVLIDCAPGVRGASAYFGWRDAPGFTEALAGISLWSEVARPVGANEGLSVDVVPAGAPRADTASAVLDGDTRTEFLRFHSEYDFAVLVAPTAAAVTIAAAIANRPPTIVVARLARTKVSTLLQMTGDMKRAGAKLHGIILLSV